MKEEPSLHQYADLTGPELQELDGDRTVFLMTVSPLEAHGPHLPLGTDPMISEELLHRYAGILKKRHPDFTPVRLPPLHLGADVLPRTGSLAVPARTLERVLFAYADSLAGQGFRYLFIADNHGGPRHLLAAAAAARRAYRRHGFYLVNPFCREFALMTAKDPHFLQVNGPVEESAGDIEDLHGGTNETSLMLALQPDHVRSGYEKLNTRKPPPPPLLTRIASNLLQLLGAVDLARDVHNLGSIMRWAADGSNGDYIGAPSRADPFRGEWMLQCRLAFAAEMFDSTLTGQFVPLQPPLWPIRALRYLP